MQGKISSSIFRLKYFDGCFEIIDQLIPDHDDDDEKENVSFSSFTLNVFDK